jgi:hypothetical protein
MLADAVDAYLDSVSERAFDEPLLALLRAQGFVDIHLVHGGFEFGKTSSRSATAASGRSRARRATSTCGYGAD